MVVRAVRVDYSPAPLVLFPPVAVETRCTGPFCPERVSRRWSAPSRPAVPLVRTLLCAALAGLAAGTTLPASSVASVSAVTAAVPSPIPAASRQMLLVTTDSWDATTGRLQRYRRSGSRWLAVGDPVATVVGRSGLGWGRGLHTAQEARPGDPTKREGDGRAPAGAFRLTAAFGYGASERTGLPYLSTDSDTECVDDVASPAYNTVRERAPGDAWTSHEEMRRGDGLYRIGVVVAHNGPGVDPALPAVAGQAVAGASTVPSGGSCIFLHVWNGPSSTTSGCTAMPDASLQTILAWLDAAAEPVLVQLPRAERVRLARAWGLPATR